MTKNYEIGAKTSWLDRRVTANVAAPRTVGIRFSTHFR